MKTIKKIVHSKLNTDPILEGAVISIAIEMPIFGVTRAAIELNRNGISVTPTQVRSIWQHNNLDTIEKRLRALIIKCANEEVDCAEVLLQALENVRAQKVARKNYLKRLSKMKDKMNGPKDFFLEDQKPIGILDFRAKEIDNDNYWVRHHSESQNSNFLKDESD